MDHGKTSWLHTKRTSAHYCLKAGDIEKFRPGRSKSDILNDTQWRGDFEAAAEYQGDSVSAIYYGLFGGPRRAGGSSVYAIFIDDKFEKFVQWPGWDKQELVETVDDYGQRRSHPKPIKTGNFRCLIRLVESAPVSIADLEKERKEKPAPSHIDYGLTIVCILLWPVFLVIFLRSVIGRYHKRNAALRDQFNAPRLKIGMTESDVESVLRAKPLESGKIDAGSYKIYGSNELLDIDDLLHFSNVLVVFKEEKVTGIYGAPAGYEWRRKLGEEFFDLPAQASMAACQPVCVHKTKFFRKT